jgi:hypothetical protein
MPANIFDAQIRAVDAASGPIRALVRGMHGIMDAARGVSKSSAEGAKAAGKAGKDAAAAVEHAAVKAEAAHLRYFRSMGAHVRLLNGHFGSLNASIGAVSGSFTKFLPMLGALGAGGSLLGLFTMTKAAAEAAVAGEALTLKLGITGKQLGGLSFAAKESGVATESMTGGLEKLNKTLGMAAAGKGKDAAALFHHLGINMKDAAGHTRGTADLMPELADAFAKTQDPAMRALMATTLFGKAGQDMLPMLMKGRKALEELTEAGAKFGYIATPEQKAGLKEFAHNWDELEAAVSGFKKQIASALGGVLAPVIAAVRDWVMANRDWIATGITEKVRVLADVIRDHATEIWAVVTSLTGWVRWTFELIESHGTLAKAIGGILLVMGSPLGGAITGAVSLFATLGRVLLSLGALMWANPILAAIGLVAGGAFLLYENWDWVKQKVGAVFTWFSTQNGWVKTLLTALAPFIFVPMQIYEHWEPVKAFFTSLWNAVTAAFDAAWGHIKPIIEQIGGAADWVANSSLGKAAGAVWNAPSSIAHSVMHAVSGGGDDQAPGAAPAALYRPDGPAMAGVQNKGEVRVKVDIGNAPPGTKVQSDATGIAQPPDTSVGYSNPLAHGY